jgi:dimethylargininase
MSLLAITREVSPSIQDCELSFHTRQPIAVAKAIGQHQAYQRCLADLGVQIVSLPAEPCFPDGVFVEDTAIVLDELAVIANMGAVSRRGETQTVAEALAAYRPMQFLVEPATLDGGDVLRIDRSVFVGLSRRTNSEAVTQLRDLLRPYNYEVGPIEVKGCLHLKSACSYIGNNTVLLNAAWINPEPLRAFDLLPVPDDEPGTANVLLINNVVIIPAFFPKTRALLEQRGFRMRTIDVSELQKAEAGVTCCSLIFKAESTHRGSSGP